MRRRTLFALPLLAVLPVPAGTGWRQTVSEIRFGISSPTASSSAADIGAALRTRVVGHRLGLDELVRAFVAGQLECAACTRPQADAIAAAMGQRVLRMPGNGVVLRSLPDAMRNDIVEAFSLAWPPATASCPCAQA